MLSQIADMFYRVREWDWRDKQSWDYYFFRLQFVAINFHRQGSPAVATAKNLLAAACDETT